MPATENQEPTRRTMTTAEILNLIHRNTAESVLIKYAKIEEQLTISKPNIKNTLRFENCYFSEVLRIEDAQCNSIEIVDCDVLGETANRPFGCVEVSNSQVSTLKIVNTTIETSIEIIKSTISGTVDLSGSRCPLISLDDLHIGGDIDTCNTYSTLFEASNTIFEDSLCNWHPPQGPKWSGLIFSDVFCVNFFRCTFNKNVQPALRRVNPNIDYAIGGTDEPTCKFDQCTFKEHFFPSMNSDSRLKVIDCEVMGIFLLPVNYLTDRRYPDFEGLYPIDISSSTFSEVTLCIGDKSAKSSLEVNALPFTALYPCKIDRISTVQFDEVSLPDFSIGWVAALRKPVPFWHDSKKFCESLIKLLRNTPRNDRYLPYCTIAFSEAFSLAGMNKESEKLRYIAADCQLRARKGARDQAWYLISKVTIGHGIYLTRAVGLLALVWAIASLVVERSASSFHPAGDAPPDAPGFWGFLYALDIVASPVGTGQSELWIPDSWCLALILWTLKLLALGLGAMFLAGVTGVANKSIVGGR